MSQRRSYSSSNDFNMDDLFRPEPAGPDDRSGSPQQHPQQQTGPTGQFQGAPEYLGQQQPPYPQQPSAEAAPETQYLPPYPTGNPTMGGQQSFGAPQGMPQGMPQGAPQGFDAQPSYGGQQSFGGQQQGFGAPQPSYGGQQSFGGQQQGFGAPQQTFGGQQSFGAPQQPYGAPSVPPGYPPAGQGYQPEGDGRRSNNKMIIGGVVAGCVAAGVLVAVLMSGGDAKSGTTATPKTKPVAKTETSAPATPGGSQVSPAMQAQAQALSDLLGTANTSRQAVIGAVGSVKKCEKLPDSQAALTQAAAQRADLVTKLATLKVDQLPNGAQLADQLQKAWQASAAADQAYAGWAADAVAACDPNKQDDPHLKDGDAASGTATQAKTQASGLWNAIATQTGLASKGPSEL
ncbi:hypothetical protein GCM10009760_22720 [Kitasatospora kazusensis]|uniref:Uncharacterized protein n=1 Tax=Kitasatospora kazusensis TaxID=407974 RepID=A0ABN2ZC03_9ACTN